MWRLVGFLFFETSSVEILTVRLMSINVRLVEASMNGWTGVRTSPVVHSNHIYVYIYIYFFFVQYGN